MVQQSINMKKLVILMLIITAFSSCQTVKEINMSSHTRSTQCNYVNR